MGRWIDDYNDVEEKLEKIDGNLSDLISDIEDIPYDDNVDYYIWNKGCYEDVSYDLEVKLDNIRNQIIKVVEVYNDYINCAKDYADKRFESCFENKEIEVVNNE